MELLVDSSPRNKTRVEHLPAELHEFSVFYYAVSSNPFHGPDPQRSVSHTDGLLKFEPIVAKINWR